MTHTRWLFLPLILLFSFLASSEARAASITAGSCSQTDVQQAISSAASGDTINVPGPCAVTWSGLSIPNTKGITLAASGTVTVGGSAAITVNSNATTMSRVTGFTFTGAGTTNEGDVAVIGSKVSAPYRIDHNTFTSASQSIFIVVSGNGQGLIDNNVLTGAGASEDIHNLAMGPGDSSGWTDDVTPGSANMVFIEDNTFKNVSTQYYCSAVQSYYGARTVFRHNTLNFCQVDQHGTAGAMGARWWEVYENTFVPGGLNQSNYCALRAGSGVVFNNHVVGAPQYGPAACEFVEEDSGSWPLAYQVGSGINGQTNQHSTCAGGTLNSSPTYVWGNDATFSLVIHNGVQSGRDVMVSATQPPSLMREQEAGDSCSTTYSYSAYTYPNPLQGQGLAPPSGLVATVN